MVTTPCTDPVGTGAGLVPVTVVTVMTVVTVVDAVVVVLVVPVEEKPTPEWDEEPTPE